MSYLPAEIIAAAQSAQTKWGIPAAISLAQFGVESDWGAKLPLYSNNPFGIKALPGQPSVSARTREVINHQSVFITAQFRKFSSFAQAFDAHGALLALGKPYAAARACLAGGLTTASVNAFASALTGVYATDPEYGATLIKVMASNNLYQYDGAPIAAPIAAVPPSAPITSQANTIVPQMPVIADGPVKPETDLDIPETPPPPPSVALPSIPKAPAIVKQAPAAAASAAGLGSAGLIAQQAMTNVNFTALIDKDWPILFAGVLAPLLVYSIVRGLQLMHFQTTPAVDAVVERGVALAGQKVQAYADANPSIDVKDAKVASAMQYVVNAIPDKLAQLGVTQAQLYNLTSAKLAQVSK